MATLLLSMILLVLSLLGLVWLRQDRNVVTSAMLFDREGRPEWSTPCRLLAGDRMEFGPGDDWVLVVQVGPDADLTPPVGSRDDPTP